MGRPSIVPDIQAVLEPYLERCHAAWTAMAPDARAPTLPSTDDGKVNVRALTLALGLKRHQEQHFYNHAELTGLVNSVAQAQGLRGIKSRHQAEAEDAEVADRFVRVQKERGELARLLAEREAVIEAQRREIAALREQLRLLEETGMVVRTATVR